MFDPEQVKDIYPLSPMQKGMLYHDLREGDRSLYFEQLDFKVEGVLDCSLLEQSLNGLIQRHEVLRTLFLHQKMRQPVQVVMKERTGRVHYVDLQSFPPEEQEQRLEEIKREDRERGFDLSRDLLFRLTLVQLGEEAYRLILSCHHILMDGWCMGILLGDLMKLYRQARSGQEWTVEDGVPYSRYIRWLEEQDEEEAFQYWQEYLEGFQEVTGLPRGSKGSSGMAEEIFHWEEEWTERLTRLARKHQVTVNTVFQTLWGLLLMKMNDTEDVTFGAVVSGRPAEIPQVEQIVGLFINTVPVRIQLKEKETFSELVKRVQEVALRSERMHYVQLAEVQNRAGVRGELFDHIVAFENYPVNLEEMDDPEGLGFRFTGMEAFEKTNYGLSLQVHHGRELVMKVLYDEGEYDREMVGTLPGREEDPGTGDGCTGVSGGVGPADRCGGRETTFAHLQRHPGVVSEGCDSGLAV